MLTRVALIASLLSTVVASASGAQRWPVPRDTAGWTRLEAINLLQGRDSLPFLDTARVQLVARALRTIRERLPSVRDIHAGRDESYLVVTLKDSAAALVLSRSGARRPVRPVRDSADASTAANFWQAPIERIGVPELDSLRLAFDTEAVILRYVVGMVRLELHFRRPMNVPVVAAAFLRSPLVRFAGSERYVGDDSWIRVIPKGPLLHFVLARGGGDCPAGCTEWDHYYVTYDTTSRGVRLEHEVPKTVRWTDDIAYWDVPTRFTITPYRTIDHLYAGLRDPRWWHRSHAVHVVDMLLGPETRPWFGAGEQSPEHFTALKRAALARKRESFSALVERLGDPDPDVARLAHGYLRQLSGQELPADRAAWTRWLRTVRAETR